MTHPSTDTFTKYSSTIEQQHSETNCTIAFVQATTYGHNHLRGPRLPTKVCRRQRATHPTINDRRTASNSTMTTTLRTANYVDERSRRRWQRTTKSQSQQIVDHGWTCTEVAAFVCRSQAVPSMVNGQCSVERHGYCKGYNNAMTYMHKSNQGLHECHGTL